MSKKKASQSSFDHNDSFTFITNTMNSANCCNPSKSPKRQASDSEVTGTVPRKKLNTSMNSVDKLIQSFHDKIMDGPRYVCSCCDQ